MDHKNQRVLLKTDICLVTQPDIVQKLGRSAALLLQQIHYWLTSQNAGGTIFENRRWIYNSAKQWSQNMRVISEPTVKRAISKLRHEGIILTKNLNAHSSNRTNWYTIDYARLQGLFPDINISFSGVTHQINLTHPSDHFDPLLNNKSENTSQNNLSLTAAKPRVVKAQNKALKNEGGSKVSENLLRIWNKTTDQESQLTKKRAQFLMAAFKGKFDSSLEKWQNFCDTVASSDFLMGRVKSTFRATLDWALKFDIIQRILEGDFGVKLFVSTDKSNITPAQIEKEIEVLSESEPIKKIRKTLLHVFGSEIYNNWFKPATLQQVGEKNLGIFSENKFCINYIRDNFGWKLEEHLGLSLSYPDR